jgi:hypothetical protein
MVSNGRRVLRIGGGAGSPKNPHAAHKSVLRSSLLWPWSRKLAGMTPTT